MPRRKGSGVWTKALLVRISAQLDKDLRTAAGCLGTDVSDLVRTILIEHLPSHIERGTAARRRIAAAMAKAAEAQASEGRAPGPKEKGAPKKGRALGPGEFGERCLEV